MKNLKACHVYAGCVNGSTFVNDLNECELRFQSHQTRIHNSYNVKFYVTARSSPIIEDCFGLTFGPFWREGEATDHNGDGKPEHASFTYDGIVDHTNVLECHKNLYDKVLDFKWHK